MAAPLASQPRGSSRFSMRSRKLGQLLLEGGDIKPEQLAQALRIQTQKGGPLGRILQELGVCQAAAVETALHRQVQITDVRCEELNIPPDVLAKVPRAQCESEKLCPFEVIGSHLCVVMGNPLNRAAVNAIEAHTRLKVKVFKAPWPKIRELLERHSGLLAEAQPFAPGLEPAVPGVAEGPTTVERGGAAAPAALPSAAPAAGVSPRLSAPRGASASGALEPLEPQPNPALTPRPSSAPPTFSSAPRAAKVPGILRPVKVSGDLEHFDPLGGDGGAELIVAGEEPREEPLQEVAASAPKESPRALRPVPAEAVAPVPLTEAEFQALAAELHPDPCGEWDWRCTSPGPLEVAECSPQ